MQALKQAAREDDQTRMDVLCETWTLPVGAEPASEDPQKQGTGNGDPVGAKIESVLETTMGASSGVRKA
jgi:hypothetical protein